MSFLDDHPAKEAIEKAADRFFGSDTDHGTAARVGFMTGVEWALVNDEALSILGNYVNDAKLAAAGERVAGEPLDDFIRRMLTELRELRELKTVLAERNEY